MEKKMEGSVGTSMASGDYTYLERKIADLKTILFCVNKNNEELEHILNKFKGTVSKDLKEKFEYPVEQLSISHNIDTLIDTTKKELEYLRNLSDEFKNII